MGEASPCSARIVAEVLCPVLRRRRERRLAAGWREVAAPVADPGNPGQVLALWEHPLMRVLGRVLICADGTTGKTHQVTVPPGLPDPLAAVAWSYSRRPEAYAPARRT